MQSIDDIGMLNNDTFARRRIAKLVDLRIRLVEKVQRKLFRRDLRRFQRLVDVQISSLTIEEIVRSKDQQRVRTDRRQFHQQVKRRIRPNTQTMVTAQTEKMRRMTREVHIENQTRRMSIDLRLTKTIARPKTQRSRETPAEQRRGMILKRIISK